MQALPAAAWHKACSSIKELPPRPLRQPAAGGDGEKPRAARKSGNISRKRGEKEPNSSAAPRPAALLPPRSPPPLLLLL